MVKISLERIISKKEVIAQLEAVLALDDSLVSICDMNSNVLLGVEENLKLQRFPVLMDGVAMGWACGGEKARAVSLLLGYICSAEFEKRTLGQETLDKYKEITVLYDVTEKLATRLDPKEVADLVVAETQRLVKSSSVSVMFYNEEKKVFEIASSLRKDIDRDIEFHLGEGIAGSVALNGKGEIINNVVNDPRFIQRSIVIYSMLCAPLMVRDRVIGVINVSINEPYNYSANDLKILSTIASQAAIAVENARLYESLREAFVTMVYTLAETIEKRDPYTGGHTRRVMDYSIAIGELLDLPEGEIERLKLGAILHDIGKIGISDAILLKNGKLTDEEFEKIKMHTLYGHEILEHIKYLHNIIPAVRQHHERFDGRGYPDRLGNDNIDIIARIIAVADTYDAMTSDRPYRKGLSHQIAFEEIRKNAGMQFDETVVLAFEKACSSGKIVREEK